MKRRPPSPPPPRLLRCAANSLARKKWLRDNGHEDPGQAAAQAQINTLRSAFFW